jgi:hypothetical protein
MGLVPWMDEWDAGCRVSPVKFRRSEGTFFVGRAFAAVVRLLCLMIPSVGPSSFCLSDYGLMWTRNILGTSFMPPGPLPRVTQ